VRNLFRSTDGGQNWTEITLADNVTPTRLVVDPSSPNTIYAITGRNPYRSTDSGSTFGIFGPAGLAVSDILPDPSQAGVICAVAFTTFGDTLYKSVDYGSTWTSAGVIGLASIRKTRPGAGLAIDPRNSNIFYAALTAPGQSATKVNVPIQ